MRRALMLLVLGLWATASAVRAQTVEAPVLVLTVSGAIGPATADYIARGLAHAEKSNAQLVILQLDTPGGLDSSMRAIIKDIIASPIPVAAYVAPSGARAASAGTYILYASHIAAMAPGTNLGAATPVQIGGGESPGKGKDDGKTKPSGDVSDTMTRKQMHDAIAYIRGLAQMRRRNAEWAESAVREAASLPAADALKLRVVDLMAGDVSALLKQLDGREIAVAGGVRRLTTAAASVEGLQPDWRTRFLSIITDPSVAYILGLVGLYAIVFELANPGLVLPGVTGAICVLIALYAFHLLPVNYAGVALIVLGLGFMLAEAFFPTYGSLGIGGVIAFGIGSVILIDPDAPIAGIPLPLIAGVSVASALLLVFMARMALVGHRQPVVSGSEEMIGSMGEMLEDSTGEGWARVHGETWRVHADLPIKARQRVRVVRIRGLVLDVVPEAPSPPAPLSGGERGGSAT